MGFGAAVKPPTRTQTRELELELELLVEGMMCQKNCGATVENALRGVEGVSSAVVSFEQRQAAMTLRRPGSATLQELVDEVGCVGFEAGAYDAVKAAAVKLQAQRQQNIQQQEKSLDKADVAFGRDLVPSARQTQLIQDAGDDDSLELKVTVAGMSGAACVGKIEAAVGALPGVSKVLVDLPPHKAGDESGGLDPTASSSFSSTSSGTRQYISGKELRERIQPRRDAMPGAEAMSASSSPRCSSPLIESIHKVVLVSDSGVGKSNLVVRFTKNKYMAHSVQTVGFEFTTKTIRVGDRRVKAQIWDTAGLERFQSLTAT
ncbi:hypothetical protein PF006_g25364 [Phytophthora fragariae]|uniref:HMA domain-containing protein n=1 Tax=Phytophthora fragariae TaxID=53985 RepID=A0A6A3R4S7_9STRA|nr:hypothetical protein PF006_g25364 [Phytophthora fragariae]